MPRDSRVYFRIDIIQIQGGWCCSKIIPGTDAAEQMIANEFGGARGIVGSA